MALIEKDPVNVYGKIDPAEVHSPEDIENSAALQLCVQDTINTESYLQTNFWSLRWREADILAQSPPSVQMWEGTTQPKSNVNRFVVAEVLNSLKPQIMQGLFYESPAFVLRERPSTAANTKRAITELLAIELEMMGIRQEVNWGIHSALLFGTGIWKWGFKSETKQETKYTPNGKPVKVPSPIAGQPATEIETPDSMSYKKEIVDKEIHLPTFEYRDIRHVLVDKGCRVPDIRKAKFVIDRMYLTYNDLAKLADEEYTEVNEKTGVKTLKKRYMLPDKDTIKSWFEPPIEQPAMPGSSQAAGIEGTTYVHHAAPQFKKTTEDPLNEPLEVLERWDNNKVITVLNRVKCIRNEANEFGVIPFLSVNWWDTMDAFWGLGLGRVIGAEQRVQQGIINASLDLANLIVNPMYVRSRGANIQEQNIRQRIGGIITVDGNVKEAFTILQQPTIPGEVIEQGVLSQGRIESTTGANQQLTMGSSGGKQGAMRSGTGASGVIQATATRVGGFAEDFVKQVYEPLLYQIHRMNKDKMPVPYIRELLGEKLGPEFKFSMDNFMDAPTEFEVLAGSHLAAKAQMAQSLFMMFQIYTSDANLQHLMQQGKKVDFEAINHMIFDVSGWGGYGAYGSVIKDMSPQEVQQYQASQNNPAQQIQGKMMLNNQKFSQQQQLVDQENEARVVRDILRHIAEKSSEPEALMGAMTDQGMGSSEAS